MEKEIKIVLRIDIANEIRRIIEKHKNSLIESLSKSNNEEFGQKLAYLNNEITHRLEVAK